MNSGGLSGRRTGEQESVHADKRAGKQVDSLASQLGRQTGKQTDSLASQLGRQTGKQTDKTDDQLSMIN